MLVHEHRKHTLSLAHTRPGAHISTSLRVASPAPFQFAYNSVIDRQTTGRVVRLSPWLSGLGCATLSCACVVQGQTVSAGGVPGGGIPGCGIPGGDIPGRSISGGGITGSGIPGGGGIPGSDIIPGSGIIGSGIPGRCGMAHGLGNPCSIGGPIIIGCGVSGGPM